MSSTIHAAQIIVRQNALSFQLVGELDSVLNVYVNVLKGSCNYELSKKEPASVIPNEDPFPNTSAQICPMACDINGDCVAGESVWYTKMT